MIYKGNQDAGWGGIYFEFLICTDCLFQLIGESMEQMSKLMLHQEKEREKRLEVLQQEGIE